MSCSDNSRVDHLLDQLERNLKHDGMPIKEQETVLGELKILGRNSASAGSIFSRRGIDVLAKYGFRRETKSTSHEALRCLANAFLLSETTRQLFVDLEYSTDAAERLKSNDCNDEFLISRIIFLLTYNTSADLDDMVNKHGLADSVNRHLTRHAERLTQDQTASSSMKDMALTETLKLLFNITYYRPHTSTNFTPSIEPIISLLVHHPTLSPPLQPPINYLLNALLNLDLSSAVMPDQDTNSTPPSHTENVIDKLISIFDQSIRSYPERELDQLAAPLCTLIRRWYELTTSHQKSNIRSALLPQTQDRDKPLGQGDSLSARLLRLSIAPGLPTLRENISCLLFELSDKDADKLIKNIGYGFASGFLMSHNIPVLASKDGTLQGDDDGVEINPVTGQRIAEETMDQPDSPEMSQEEKEREAERLFVLFERLRATGVVDVQNPVQKAVEEGRFEELPD
ncbi:hypothetical protein K470DRAFT_283130 [Piedraia hortae CBS 480.64]|uniref:Guanine nucleotide exchange factor n=1 Tax=Piedraia hortae CBS 480.64 TaxID=1314780 RepID=A0A6A7BU66_9PEZI|nr:hypothetical protein K470DRAFT_283130 [Piedraia hortae CBS 480.64]